MSDQAVEAPKSESPASVATKVDPNMPLPSVATVLAADKVLATLDRASKRGKLPGYRTPAAKTAARDGGTQPLFTMTDFGRPFESVLEAHYRAADGTNELGFRARVKPLVPMIYAIVLILTVWPGVWLTDSMLKTYFSWYVYTTAYWYLPLTAPFVPWGMRSAMKKSRKSAHAEALELIEDVRKTLKAAETSTSS